MDVIIKDEYQAMGVYAAKCLAEVIKRKPNAVLGLATGTTPLATYNELIRMHREEGLDFSSVTTFNLDEYLGIGKNMDKSYLQDQSYARFMYESLFKHVNIDLNRTHVPDGLSQDPSAFCEEYEAKIKAAGGIDIQLLGIGGDGHWAFNEPGTSLSSRTHVEVLTQQTLDDNYELFYRKAGFSRDQMPHFALTMGVGTILDARALLMMASGSKKASVVAKAIEGPVTSQITSTAIQLYKGRAIVVLDEAAASELKNKEHYLHVEKVKSQFV